jgi:hypothetical protein
MISKSNRLSIAAAATFLCATSAFGQENYATPEQKAALHVRRLQTLQQLHPGATKAETCLRQNKSGLSNACRSVFEQGTVLVASSRD